MKKLPKKPSKLIRIALKDLSAVERMRKKYIVDMGTYHTPGYDDDGRCAVCLAGSVMVNSFKTRPDKEFAPCEFPGNSKQLLAIDCLRVGNVEEALGALGVGGDLQICFDRGITDYGDSKRAFKKEMRILARDLERNGL